MHGALESFAMLRRLRSHAKYSTRNTQLLRIAYTGNLDEEEEIVKNIVRSFQLYMTLKLGLDVLKDWLDRVAVRIACRSQNEHTTRLNTIGNLQSAT